MHVVVPSLFMIIALMKIFYVLMSVDAIESQFKFFANVILQYAHISPT